MAGHSKWANIKHKKAAQDAKRGKKFTKLTKEISVAAKTGGGLPEHNPRLRLLIEKARDINMPLDNVKRAIQRGTGELPGVNYEPQTYEAYGPNKIAIIIETLTDNKNRTVGELRSIFTKGGGNIGETGSVGWMFNKLGVIRIKNTNVSEDELLEKLIEYDIHDIKADDELVSITCEPTTVHEIKQALVNSGYKVESAELEWVPNTTVELNEEDSEKAYDFLSTVEDHDDVQNVYTNLIS
jgi:YebC/PmpR family DNA-binding regulatory protein